MLPFSNSGNVSQSRFRNMVFYDRVTAAGTSDLGDSIGPVV
jgi:hypothetical protein